jgi:hypothetical protein
MTATMANGAHLVGSVPLADEVEVFGTVAATLGQRVRRIPDGETGPRFMWIGWQQHVFERTAGLVQVAAPPIDDGIAADYEQQSGATPPPQFVLADGVTADEVDFGALGYADAALASYKTFVRLRDEGTIAAATRFQVSMGTPLATASAFLAPAALAAVEPRYEEAQMRELRAILDGIPHEDLAIQWDVAVEVWMNEGWIPAPFAPVLDGLVERLVRYSEAVPDDVELGYHMCYGDLGGHHLREPTDTAGLVELMNPVFDAVRRPIAWWHFPVPIDRDDAAYFAPLAELRLPEGTEVYAGVVHVADGAEGAQRRLDPVRAVFPDAGVATECGMGRRSPQDIEALLAIHAEISRPRG